jgi:serine/threonine protein phosphatase PrpC
MGTDGLWDNIENPEIVKIVQKFKEIDGCIDTQLLAERISEQAE